MVETFLLYKGLHLTVLHWISSNFTTSAPHAVDPVKGLVDRNKFIDSLSLQLFIAIGGTRSQGVATRHQLFLNHFDFCSAYTNKLMIF